MHLYYTWVNSKYVRSFFSTGTGASGNTQGLIMRVDVVSDFSCQMFYLLFSVVGN